MMPLHQYMDKQVVVLGMARSGVAAAKLLHNAGARVTVNDQKERSLCPEAAELEQLGITVICGEHPDTLLNNRVALVVKNPGIPYTAAPIKRAEELGIEIVSEIELAFQICPAPIIGITGSNGKTTTTTWIGEMMRAANLQPVIAGNIGRALCDAAVEATEDDWMVVELSSFQLKGTRQFKPHIACLLNIYETHLDYHHSMADYIASKARIFTNQTQEDIAVINWDNAECRKLIPQIRAEIIPFSMTELLDKGVFLHKSENGEEQIVFNDGKTGLQRIIATSAIGLPGRHNIENALAAVAVSLAAGVSADLIAKSLHEFRGVEHRLEFVATLHGVTYINGSKATNPAATIKDLAAFEQPIVLIAGGLERGMDYSDLAPYFHHKLRAIVTLGQTRNKLNAVAQQTGLGIIYSVAHTSNSTAAMEEAVKFACSVAKPGDVVLLSPACASWDMFTSYEERGRIFKMAVHTL